MYAAVDVVRAIGPSVFSVVVEPAVGREARDVFLAEPGDRAVGGSGDLVLGIGPGADAVALVERCADSEASGLVLRRPFVEDPAVRAVAERRGVLLVGLQDGVTWAHVVWMVRGVLDRAAAPGSPVAGDAAVHNDLFSLADAVAAVVDAPVTIEDNQSRVLAYSSGQDSTDPARVSTIVGRRVPPEVVAHFRARGVFRRLASSSKPFYVPEGPGGTLPRLVVPVRAGQEWLGSIWAVVSGPVSEETSEELSNTASVLALYLLRYRALADVARGQAVERLRSVLRPRSADSATGPSVPLLPGPWRVVALSAGVAGAGHAEQLDLWAATCRRHAWADPLLADMDDGIFAVVTQGTGPGSWTWLQRLLVAAHREDRAVRAAASSAVPDVEDLPRARAQAVETLGVVTDDAPVVTFDDAWAALILHRATAGLAGTSLAGPVAVLGRHDRAHRTAYVETLGVWLAYPGQPQRAARALHVHPNTLRHRMMRLREMVDLDLSDPRQRLALQLQIEAGRNGRGDGALSSGG